MGGATKQLLRRLGYWSECDDHRDHRSVRSILSPTLSQAQACTSPADCTLLAYTAMYGVMFYLREVKIPHLSPVSTLFCRAMSMQQVYAAATDVPSNATYRGIIRYEIGVALNFLTQPTKREAYNKMMVQQWGFCQLGTRELGIKSRPAVIFGACVCR